MRLGFTAFLQEHCRIRRLTDFIGTHLDDDELRLSDLADIACLSPGHLLRFYRARTNESPMHTVRRLRLLRAYSTLLSDKTVSVTQLAFEAAYDSNAAFTHAFRKQFGMAPSHVRQLPASHAVAPPPLQLERLPERKVWQFSYAGRYAENGRYKALLAWLCLRGGGRRWRGWRLNDRDHPFTEIGQQRVELAHFVPFSEQPRALPGADLKTHAGGLYARVDINPLHRVETMASLAERVRAELGCVLTGDSSLERDLHLRDYRPPQERRIALYVPVAPLHSARR